MDLRESMRDSAKVFSHRSACTLVTELFCLETFMVYGMSSLADAYITAPINNVYNYIDLTGNHTLNSGFIVHM